MTGLPQAAMACAVKAEKLGYVKFMSLTDNYHGFRLDTLRGCVATSRQWLFFVYSRSDLGRMISYLPPLEMDQDFGNLPLVLGLLRDWVS
jgi:hypothetical protein